MPPEGQSLSGGDRTELVHWMALTLAPSIGPVTARLLVEKLGSAGAVISQDRRMLEKIRGIGPRLSGALNTPLLVRQAEQELEFVEKHRIGIFHFRDPGYPQRLNLCQDGPVLLYAKGSIGLNFPKSISVVGTRRATSYGRDICRKIIRDLSEKVEGLVIISGLAYGIDVIAHRAALEYGLPTVAVLGHGFQTIYPSSHRDVARKILRGGALVTDFHSGTGPERNNFIRRNRIIAGMSDATLVVESGRTGGALITADLASSYERDLFAVPGRACDTWSAGCNGMIKQQAAVMAESADDIIQHMNWEPGNGSGIRSGFPSTTPTAEELRILAHLRDRPGMDPGVLSGATGIPVHTLLALLLKMELKEWIRMEPGNRYHPGVNCPG